jgi:hypothetical protein
MRYLIYTLFAASFIFNFSAKTTDCHNVWYSKKVFDGYFNPYGQ